MTVSKNPSNTPEGYAIESKMPKTTSVTAHVVTSISVNMNYTEMDALMETFGRDYIDLTEQERAIQREFVQAVRALR
jgi:hypothetical protein